MQPLRLLAGMLPALLVWASAPAAQAPPVIPGQTVVVRAEPPSLLDYAGGTDRPAARTVAPPSMPPVPVRDAGLPPPDSAPVYTGAAGPAAPCDLRLWQNRIVSPAGASKSSIGDPTIALRGTSDPYATQGLYTGNWFAGISTDGGANWTHVSPYTSIPSLDGGFCCHQLSMYVPSVDAIVWYLQYAYSSITRRGSVRVMRATGNLVNWSGFIFAPQTFGRPDFEYFDYPDMACSDTHIYFTSNVFDAGDQYRATLIWTMALADFVGFGGNVGFWTTTNASIRFARGSGTVMYAATHADTSTLRVLKFTGSSLAVIDRTHPTWAPGPYTSLTPSGVNWAARLDGRITGAYRTPTEYAFLWAANAGAGRPHPYTRVSRYRVADDTLIGDEDLWSSGGAILYGSAAGNDAGHVGFAIAYGGPSAHPATYCGLVDDCAASWGGNYLAPLATSNASPATPGWGDFYSVQRHPVRSLNFIAAGMGQINGSAASNQVFTWGWFGRERDDPAAVTVAVQSVPESDVPIPCTADRHGRTQVSTPAYLSYAASASYTLTARAQYRSAANRVYTFKSWRYRSHPGAAFTEVSTANAFTFTNDARDDVCEANYDRATQVVLGARNVTAGVPVTCPTDLQGNGSATTPFARHYTSPTTIVLTAPARLTWGPMFRRWWVNGSPHATGGTTLLLDIVAGADTITAEPEYYSYTRGTTLAYGSGCVGSGLAPPGLLVGNPERGTTMPIYVRTILAPVSTVGVIALGVSRTTWLGLPLPLDLGFLGMGPACFVHASGELLLPVAIDGTGFGAVNVPLPPNLPIGLHLYTQAQIYDPGVATPTKVIMSNAIDIMIGGTH